MANKPNTVALKGLTLSFDLSFSPLLTNGSGGAMGNGRKFYPGNPDAKLFAKVHYVGTDCATAEAAVKAITKVHQSAEFGDTLIEIDGYPATRFAIFGSTWLTKRVEFKHDPRESEVTVTVHGSWTADGSTAEKFVCDGGKVRVHPAVGLRCFKALTGEARPLRNLTITAETFKGGQFFGPAAAEWLAKRGLDFGAYDPDKGFTDEQLLAMGNFIEAKGELVTWVYEVNEHTELMLRSLYEGRPEWTFYGDGLVAHTTKVVSGEIVMALESTCTYQNVSAFNLTPAMLLNLGKVHPELAEHLWEKAARKRGSFQGALSMAFNNPKHSVPVIVVTPAGSAEFGIELPSKDDRTIVVTLAKKYPLGFTLDTGSFGKVYVDICAVRDLGAFSQGGTGYSYAEELCDLIRFLMSPKKLGDATGRVKKAMGQIAADLVMSLVDSRRTAANLLRTGNGTRRKVLTTFRKAVGWGELHVNPFDPLVIAGKLVEGQVVGVSRIPADTFGSAVVVFDENTPIGVFEVDALFWHACNEGDADGDDIGVLFVPEVYQKEFHKRFQVAAHGGWRGYFTLRGSERALLGL